MAARLTLTLSTAAPGGTPAGASIMLHEGRMTIGRGPDNDWVLADPERLMSKQHCEIAWTGEAFVLTDTSTNGVFINTATAPVGRGQTVALNPGDCLRLGDYEILARIEDDTEREDIDDYARDAQPWNAFEDRTYYGAGSAPQHDEGRDDGPDWVGGGGDDRREERRGASGFSPFEDQQASWSEDPIRPKARPRPPATTPDHTPAEHDVMRTPRVQHEKRQEILGKDWDSELDDLLGDAPLKPGTGGDAGAGAPRSEPPPPARTEPPPSQGDDLDDLDDFDKLLGAGPLDQQDAAAAPEPPDPPPAVEAEDDTLPAPDREEDQQPTLSGPFVDEEPEPEAAPPTNPFAQDDPETAPTPVARVPRRASDEGKKAPPTPAAPPEASPVTSPGASAGGADANADALLAAFLRGAGLARAPADLSPEELMETAGALLMTMTDGLRDLLAARATVKSEIRAEQTMIRARGNNALKFSVSAEEALERLLSPPGPAYMNGRAATEEAFKDLRTHELATMAGSAAAIKAVLATFDPAQLEGKLSARQGLGGLLSGGRKARLWELFEAHFRELADEATEDYDSRFQREFRKAYERLSKDV
ncbi:type VI secretion system-associated FHA domain protein TagH [uncultured Rhodospira sp.]|uniref:type VI secretion system-associated FHA domain protein TagH n=1 Tax=uncultured Rhodospira sp. TaxID=1936189 RepID=UPI00261C8C2B|nr:type VI secretion system-associated FHA domain protein TagH [uncultured Rhodospira sp.]